MKKTLVTCALASILPLCGCGIWPVPISQSKGLNPQQIPADQAVFIVSTTSRVMCKLTATSLRMDHIGHTFGNNQLVQLNSGWYTPTLPGGEGFITVASVEPGTYAFSLHSENAQFGYRDGQTYFQPFDLVGGKITYLGNIDNISESCGKVQLRITDKFDRDISAVQATSPLVTPNHITVDVLKAW